MFQREYFDRGSDGLKAFVEARIESADELVAALERWPRYYASARESTLRVGEMRDGIRQSFRKLEGLLDTAVFPDVYFLIGRLNSGGTLAEAGLLIGTEIFARTEPAPLEELGSWLSLVTRPVEVLPHTVAHELIHYQQLVVRAPQGPTEHGLLEFALIEGAAEFLGEVISGDVISPHIHEYGRRHERRLWERFEPEMTGNALDGWFYQGDWGKDEPADLGYFVGYRICEAYYTAAADKRQAVKDLIEAKDPIGILEASGYGQGWPQARSLQEAL